MTTLSISIDGSTFQKTGGPTNAKVRSDGDIDLSNVSETNIDIEWTLIDGKLFKKKGIVITGNGSGKIFKNFTRSANKEIFSVTDANPENEVDTEFNYVVQTKTSEIDPKIKNRS